MLNQALFDIHSALSPIQSTGLDGEDINYTCTLSRMDLWVGRSSSTVMIRHRETYPIHLQEACHLELIDATLSKMDSE